MIKEPQTANRRLAKKRVQCLSEVLCFYQSLCLPDTEMLQNRHLRVAPKRYGNHTK